MELSLVVRFVVFVTVLVIFWTTSLASGGLGQNDLEPKGLGIPFCAPEVAERQVNRLVFVSTMDGKISALNLDDGGEQKWSIETGPGPMLSSSIHNLELSNNGQWVRMIPSLTGGLYKMNGKSIEAVPINAENLLKSSFRYSDDIVISGGIESRTYGVDSATGKVLYECSMSSCDNQTTQGQREAPIGDVILIQRQTQTVRAIEPRDGTERWNFSVGQHELKLSPDPSASCHDTKGFSADEVVLKVIVPDGLICALDSSGTVIWKHKESVVTGWPITGAERFRCKDIIKLSREDTRRLGLSSRTRPASGDGFLQNFEYPVVSAWRVGRSGDIKGVDLFGGTRTPEEKVYLPESPVLYVGMHNKQLYIQESVRLRNKILESVDRLRHHLITDSHLPSIPWRPIPAKTHILGIEGSSEPILRITDEAGSTELHKTTALSVLYASEYVNGQGFYLYASGDDTKMITHENSGDCNTDDKVSQLATPESPESPFIPSNVSEYDGDDDGTFIEDAIIAREETKEETPVQVIIVSFWYWWKEVMLTSIFTAIVVNLIIQRRFISILYSGRLNELNSSSLEENTNPLSITTTTTSGGSVLNLSTPVPSAEFTSRYLTDFEPIRRLGRGGFGIVFQAKNKMDDCEYAIKRIPLPNKEEALERMKREVKALAKLDHQNIVRYFNSWVEEPPPGWQETADNLWLRGREDVASSDVNIDLSGAVTPTSDPPSFAGTGTAAVRKRNVFKSLWDKASSAIYRSESVDKDLVLPRTSDDASGSFIVFENSKSKTDSKTGGATSRISSDSSDDEASDGDDVEENHETDITDVSKSNGNSRRHRRPVTLDLGSSDSFVPTPRLRKFLYIQMQLCQRDSLKDWLVSNPVRDRPKVLNMFDQIVSAVDYVHCQGLIHRDLKPSNIFFSYDGQVKVGDFGLVTTMSEDEGVPEQRSPLFQNGILGNCHTAHVGTHLYMSPEQLAGRQYDYKVDIFSLGVILFELLTAFSTEMERAKTLSSVRRLVFPDDFERDHADEAALLRLMLCDDPDSRLTTIGVRSRPPLRKFSSNDSSPEDSASDWHFTLPHRTRLRPSTSE